MNFKLLVLLTFCCYEVSTLKCYNCESRFQEGCKDPFNKKDIPIYEKQENGYVCVKTKLKDEVGRAIATQKDADAAKENKPKDGILETCKTDLCNGAPQLVTSAAIILSMAYALHKI